MKYIPNAILRHLVEDCTIHVCLDIKVADFENLPDMPQSNDRVMSTEGGEE